MNYLEESTNLVKSKNKLSMNILITAYLVIWALALISFWVFPDLDALGYSIMCFWVLLPVTTFIVSLIIGKNNYLGHKKWLLAIGFGVMYMLAEYGTFSAANMISFEKINYPDFEMIAIGAVFSLIGLGIGASIHCISSRKNSRKN